MTHLKPMQPIFGRENWLKIRDHQSFRQVSAIDQVFPDDDPCEDEAEEEDELDA